MKRTVIAVSSCGALSLFALALSLGCSDLSTEGRRDSTAPPSDPGRPLPPPPAVNGPPPPFPTVSSADTVYDGPTGLYDELVGYHGSSLPSRYVLASNGRFQLQFASFRFGIFTYDGRYYRTDSLVTFTWDGWSTAGPWVSTALVRGDTLVVRYNIVMMMSDFIDGEYVRRR